MITAGYCSVDPFFNRVSGTPPYVIEVIVGTERSGSGTVARHAVRILQAPGSDAALVELDEAVTSIEPLAVSRDAPAPGEDLVLAGWGSTDAAADPTHRPERLQSGEFEVAGVAPRELTVTATGPKRTTSACPMDSGAPYMSPRDGKPRLVATVTNGPPCPHALPGTAARTDVIADWIAGQTGTRN
ncbi:trypsin-like serine protease [Actinomycetospora flava]|uniref:Trypsin-like serine protease n=1 Tax=Actinomycetospora flava TaxID=3129232 RepID=A0ABU8M9D8_9PSEU